MRVVNEHHENFDGSGYPSGLCESDISPLARICAVVDAFDAITYDREYRVRASYEVALHELVSWSGRQFDPEVVAAFKRVPRERWFEAVKHPYEEVMAASENWRLRISEQSFRTARRAQRRSS